MGTPATKRTPTLEELEALEDAADVEASRKAVEEMLRAGEKPTPWREVFAELGLDDDDQDTRKTGE